MATINYDSFFYDVEIGNVDVDNDTFFLMLTTSSYTPSKAHGKRSDITNEVSGTGYSAGGKAVTLTPSLDTTNHRVDITIGAVSWASSTITARYGVIYKSRGGASSADNLVCALDFGADITDTNGTFTVTPSSPLRISN